MAPKNSRNSGEKADAAGGTQAKRLNREMIPGIRSPAAAVGRTSRKTSAGVMKDSKSSIPPASFLVEDKSQTMIMGFWKEGPQENKPEHIAPHQGNTQTTLNGEPGVDSREGMHLDGASKGKNSLLTWLQAPENPEAELLEGNKDHLAPSNYKEIHTPLGENMQPGFVEQEMDNPLQVSQGEATSLLMGDAGGPRPMVQTSETGVDEIGTQKKGPNWPEDGGDKFYSLTEDSDSSNSDQSLTETGASISSKSGSFLSLAGSTVRQQ
ncbi:hypothetical protein NDU88_005452 [Pleurodeles waltl]|uniref:Uncharacterized protein n=1 Tax=Pleurodeles waltl TaxID=8319 RepID=A0AAV7NML3_PLEWA|nr:hypothetical protein NDU88_005452 [Pleurodeles waltl]